MLKKVLCTLSCALIIACTFSCTAPKNQKPNFSYKHYYEDSLKVDTLSYPPGYFAKQKIKRNDNNN